jgi:rfaE bifunctional protein nucleotidyltransferase chain/domain
MADKKIVFTNGCFDILHVGHVRYLEEAKYMGDTLIVGINSDHSFRMLRNRNPYIPQEERAEILEALWAVDEVIVFNEETPLELIKRIKPDVLVKGSDYKPEDVVGREYAGEVICFDVEADVHTTDIIKKIKESTQ